MLLIFNKIADSQLNSGMERPRETDETWKILGRSKKILDIPWRDLERSWGDLA